MKPVEFSQHSNQQATSYPSPQCLHGMHPPTAWGAVKIFYFGGEGNIVGGGSLNFEVKIKIA